MTMLVNLQISQLSQLTTSIQSTVVCIDFLCDGSVGTDPKNFSDPLIKSNLCVSMFYDLQNPSAFPSPSVVQIF